MRFPRKLAGLLLAAGMAASATAATTEPARASTEYYVFATTTAGAPGSTVMCLEADPGPDFAYRVTQQPCNNQNPAQQWTDVEQGGFSKFVNHAVGWCLDAHVPTPALAGAPVILWDCNATFSDERWQLVLHTFGIGTLQSRAWNTTGYCLTIPGGQNLAGLWTQLQACNNGAPEAQTIVAGLVSA